MKKLLAGIMLTSLLAFAACGGDEAEEGEDGEDTPAEETTEVDAE